MGRRKSEQSQRTGAGKRGKSRKPKIATAAPVKKSEVEPPQWMVDQGGADAVMIWREVIVPRISINAIRENEHNGAARYCVHFSDWLDADRNVKRDGYTIDTPMTGGVGMMKRLNPEAKRRQVAENALVTLEREFGLSPMARYQLRNRAGLHPQSDFGLFGGQQTNGAAGNTPRESHDDARDAAPQAPPAAAPDQSPIGVLHS